MRMMKMKVYKVSFTIKGNTLDDINEVDLNKENIRDIIIKMDSKEALKFFDNKATDCSVSDIKIKEVGK